VGDGERKGNDVVPPPFPHKPDSLRDWFNNSIISGNNSILTHNGTNKNHIKLAREAFIASQ
jgi:hypothetical protein